MSKKDRQPLSIPPCCFQITKRICLTTIRSNMDPPNYCWSQVVGFLQEKNLCFHSLFIQETGWRKTTGKKEEVTIWGWPAWRNLLLDKETLKGHFNRHMATKVERTFTGWSTGVNNSCRRVISTGKRTGMKTIIMGRMSIYQWIMCRSMKVIGSIVPCWIRILTSWKICHWDAIMSSSCPCSLKTTRLSRRWFSRKRKEITKTRRSYKW